MVSSATEAVAFNYLVTATYGTPGGDIRHWSGNVLAANITEAAELGKAMLRRQRRVARIFILRTYPPESAKIAPLRK